MDKDLMKKLKVPRLEDFGPEGLLGFTRSQLLEMERLANAPPSSHTSSIQREQFQLWREEVNNLHKSVVLLEFDKHQDLVTLYDIIDSVKYLKA